MLERISEVRSRISSVVVAQLELECSHTKNRKETLEMQIGMIGLGRMGANMVKRLIKGGHECVVYDQILEQYRSWSKRAAQPVAIHLKSLSLNLKHPDQSG